MSVCTFFGHRECYGLDTQILQSAIEELIGQGVDTFYVGNQGEFDALVYRCLKQLRKNIPISALLLSLPISPQKKERVMICRMPCILRSKVLRDLPSKDETGG